MLTLYGYGLVIRRQWLVLLRHCE